MYNEELDTFLLVAKMGSFSKAAEKMYISRNAVMQQINLLEKQTDLTLFIRTTHGVKLTNAGKVFLQQIQKFKELANNINETMQKYQNTISIGTGFLNRSNLIEKYWLNFQKLYPNEKIDFIDIQNYEFIPDNIQLIEGVLSNKPFIRQGFKFQKITTIPYAIAVPRNSKLVLKDKIDLSDLENQTILLPDNSIYNFDSKIIQQLATQSNTHIEYFSKFDTALISKIQLQDKLIFLPKYLHTIFPEESVKPTSLSVTADYGIFYKDTSNEITQNFIHFLTQLSH